MRGALALALAITTGFTSVSAAPLPLAESTCASGNQVDAAFRDAAVAALERLIVRAPGRPADGALRVHHTAGHVDPAGAAWHQVSAYHANLGLMGALRVAPRLLPVAENWLRWQARNMALSGESSGIVLDHWIHAKNFEQSTCPPGMAHRLCRDADAYDSTAASLLLMADAFLRYGGDAAVLREPELQRALELAARAILVLTVVDGLTIAKPSHRVVYTMDATEVVAGWRAWARVQRDAYGDRQAAAQSLLHARRGEIGMQTRLWDGGVGAWRASLEAGAPHYTRWYADTVAQAWPMLWGIRTVPQSRQHAAWRSAIAHWQGTRHWAQENVDPDGFWWPSVAVAATCTGDVASASVWVARARRNWLDPKSPFPWPFQISDLLWLLWLADGPAR